MRVLVVGRSVLPYGPGVGGAELAGYYLVAGLAELGHKVHFVTDVGELTGVPEEVVVHDVSTWYKRSISRASASFAVWLLQHLVSNLLAARTARSVLRQEQYNFDVIHGYGDLATLLLCLCKRDIPIVYAERDPGPWEGQYSRALESGIRKLVFRLLDAEVFRRADHTIFLGEAGEREAITRWGVAQTKVSTIPNGADLDMFKPRPEAGEVEVRPELEPGYCLYVGKLTTRKGVDGLLAALVGIDARCVIAGDGPLRKELERLAGELGLSERVLFLGPVPRAELPELYRKAAMLVLPSHADTMPFVLLEAMASGTPPVASSIYGIPMLVQHGYNGLLVKPGDVEGLRATIGKLVADPELAKELGRSARDTVVREFTWTVHAQKVVRVYESLVRRRAPRGEVEE
jgi:glycosyltransferase involved in cell wall biosynthesis